MLVNGFGQYVQDAELGGYEYRQSARVLLLDAADPAEIEELGSYSVPGEIIDSCRVGDVLYVVSVENGYCWRCDTYANTTITSLDVADPSAVSIVDQVRFDGDGSDCNYWHPVLVTDKRIYVGSDSWNEQRAEQRSIIRVVDISDPAGMLAPGSDVAVEGSIATSLADGRVPVRAAGDRAVAEVRFFIDRLDLSDSASPALLEPVNVPGVVVDFDPQSGRTVTLDLHVGEPIASDACGTVPAALEREDGCFAVTFVLSLLEVDARGRW